MPPNNAQTIEDLRARYARLNEMRIKAQANHDHAQQELSRLKSEAREKWGTDDVAQLQQKLQEIEAENERKRAEYQSRLDKIEADLKAVDQQFTPERSRP